MKRIWSSDKNLPIVGKGWTNQFYDKETKQLFTYRIDSTMRLTKKARKEFYEKTGIRLTTDGRMSRSQPNSITHAYTVAESRRIRHQKLTIKYGLLNE
jgi:hypothetical protein